MAGTRNFAVNLGNLAVELRTFWMQGLLGLLAGLAEREERKPLECIVGRIGIGRGSIPRPAEKRRGPFNLFVKQRSISRRIDSTTINRHRHDQRKTINNSISCRLLVHILQ